MKLSVIIPNYNHAPYLRQRIDSILNQTFQDFELILLDDCSTDESREVLLSYKDNPRVTQIVFNDTNGGSPFAQWNKGIELAQGEWIWIAESDDYAEPTFLETIFNQLISHPQCGFAYTWTNWVDTNGNKLWETLSINQIIEYQGFEYIQKKLLFCNSIANVSECIFKKNLYKSNHVYRYKKMRLCGDWFFYVLLAEQTLVLEIQTPLSNYRQHNTNVSSSAEQNGLTFLEGINVLEYILALPNINIKNINYAKMWGRMLAKYQRQYQISSNTMKKIFKRLKNHSRILFFYHLYNIKYLVCQK